MVDIFFSFIFLIKYILGMTSRNDRERLVYSASVVLKGY